MIAEISGKTKLAGVIGWPVTHSLSPAIHNYWLAENNIDAVYIPLPIKPEMLQKSFPVLGNIGFAGVNLTLPHKELVLPVLDTIDPVAKKIGAVNTILFRDGLAKGFNTDAYGFWKNVKEQVPDIRRSNAFVIGAGGAARAVVTALEEAGYEKIYVMNRTLDKVIPLQDIFPKIQAVQWDSAPDILRDTDLVVNTSSLGMIGQPPLELSLGALPSHAVVNDIVYSPLETDLLKAAKTLNYRTVDGFGMLLYQAQKAFDIWFDILPKVTSELRHSILGKRL